ncbi:MAG: rRNA maturation RNase YbeY [Bacteroidota bacterium]
MDFEQLESHFFPDEENVISYFMEDVDVQLPAQEKLNNWISHIIELESGQLQQLNFIFCSDAYLHQLNVSYLDHDTLTDVISFPYSSPPNIQGDIFISIERIKANATIFEVSFLQELLRVMIHGVLHFCGYGDKSKQEAQLMRSKEDNALMYWKE